MHTYCTDAHKKAVSTVEATIKRTMRGIVSRERFDSRVQPGRLRVPYPGGTQGLGWRREGHRHSVAVEGRPERAGHRLMHGGGVAVPLDVRREAVLLRAPGHGAGARRQRVALEVHEGPLRGALADEIHQTVTQAGHVGEVDRNMHEIIFTAKALTVQHRGQRITSDIMGQISEYERGHLCTRSDSVMQLFLLAVLLHYSVIV